MKTPITDHQAVGDGATMNTSNIQRAIDACAGGGGGTVVVPPGTFLTGSLKIPSRVTLEIEPGGILLGSPDIADYPPIPFFHNEFKETRSLLWAIGEADIRLTGGGEIDFNHPAFMDMDTPAAQGLNGDKVPFYNQRQIEETTVVAKPRPNQPLFFHGCKRVVVENVFLRRSPCWTLTLSCCDDVKIRGITIDNHLRVPNCDGVHVSASRNVLITGSVFSCGDDCVAVTCITDWDRPSENIVVTDCTMASRSAGVRVGYLASKVRNVVLSNLVISDSNRGVGIFAGDGGRVENVQASNLVIHTRIFAGSWWGSGEPLVIATAGSAGRIENVKITLVTAFSESGIVLAGGGVKSILLRDWDLQLSHGENRPLLGNWVDLQPAESRPLKKGTAPWLYATDVEGLDLQNIRPPRLLPGGATELVIDPIVERVSWAEPAGAIKSGPSR